MIGFGIVALLLVTMLGVMRFAFAAQPASEQTASDNAAAKSQEKESSFKSPDATGKKDNFSADFTSIKYIIGGSVFGNSAETIEVKGDGSCIYTIDGRPARGKEKEWPEARQTFNINAEKLRQLENLLKKTDWLTAAGGEGRETHTDAAEVNLYLTRGKNHSYYLPW